MSFKLCRDAGWVSVSGYLRGVQRDSTIENVVHAFLQVRAGLLWHSAVTLGKSHSILAVLLATCFP